MLPQVTRAILENPNDKTNVYLIYANVTFEDILLKVMFLALSSMHSLYLICSTANSNLLGNKKKQKKDSFVVKMIAN